MSSWLSCISTNKDWGIFDYSTFFCLALQLWTCVRRGETCLPYSPSTWGRLKNRADPQYKAQEHSLPLSHSCLADYRRTEPSRDVFHLSDGGNLHTTLSCSFSVFQCPLAWRMSGYEGKCSILLSGIVQLQSQPLCWGYFLDILVNNRTFDENIRST